MDLEIRRITTADEAEQSRRLAQEAFGMPARPDTEPARVDAPGAITVAAFDGPVMAARMTDRAYDSWFGGRLVPTSGIGGVTVAMEYRGRKLLQPMFAELFAIARERGAVISALYPSASAIYRRLGYEVICTAEPVRIPIAALSRVRRPDRVLTRRATAADVPAIKQAYDGWAAAQNGPLSRRGPSFPATDEELIASYTGITVAEQDGRVLGYASWHRGQDWGASAVLKISDLIATTADGYRALLADFASFAGLLGELEINSSGLDLVRHLLPTSDWRPGNSDPYMIKILDLPGALSARGYPAGVRASLDFGVAGDPITGIDGRYRFELESGRASCVRTGDLLPDAGVPVFTPGGLAIAYAGAQSCQGIRMVGGLSGPETDDDVWTTVFAGRPVRIHDHF